MSETLIERLRQWPSCPAGADPMSSVYVGDLMKEAADEIERLREALHQIDARTYNSAFKRVARAALAPTTPQD
jgi:hypothetical protein